MNFFDKILGGSIPLNVIDSIEGIQNKFKINNQYKYLQINENMVNEVGNAPLDMTKLLDSPYGSHINTSLELNREKVFIGLHKLLNAATNDALNQNRNELASLINLKEDNQNIDKVVKQYSYDLSNSIILLVSGLKMDEQMKKILINIIHLTGITNKSINELRDIEKKITLLLELPNDFKNNTRIHIYETFKQKLTPINIKKCEKDLIHKCIFDNEFLYNLSHVLLQSLEIILGNIMNLTKYDKICYFYAFSVELSNAIVTIGVPEPKTPKSQTLKKKIIENFALDIANTKINTNSQKVKDIKDIEKKIDQSKVISGMNKMLSSAITKATSKNQGDLLKAIAASNKISIANVKGTSFNLSNLDQKAISETKTEATFVQKIANKVINDISVSLKQNIDMAQKDSMADMNKSIVDEKAGTSLGDILSGVAGVAGNTVGKIVDGAVAMTSLNIANSTTMKTDNEITKELKEKFDLNQSFQFKDDNDVANKLENLLSSENLAKCVEETKIGNEVNLGTIDVKGEVNISNVKQEAVVNSVMKCAFNQDILNDISNKIINSQEKLIKQLIENTNEKLDASRRSNQQGDIMAFGTAGAAIVASAGTAVADASKGLGEGIGIAGKGLGEGIGVAGKGLGEGIGTAAEGVGKGVSTAAEGVGKGVSSSLEGIGKGLLGPLQVPLMIAAAIAGVGLVIFLIMKFKGGDNDGD